MQHDTRGHDTKQPDHTSDCWGWEAPSKRALIASRQPEHGLPVALGGQAAKPRGIQVDDLAHARFPHLHAVQPHLNAHLSAHLSAQTPQGMGLPR